MVVLLVSFSSVAEAVLTVDATVTPLVGSFLYEISITNTGPEDIVIVSIVDAPIGDPLIDPSLMFPAGFFASYDGGVGIVDFLEDTSLFAAGTTTSGFSFESSAAPGPGVLSSFEALSDVGDFFTGNVQTTVVSVGGGGSVPEPSTVVAGILGLFAIFAGAGVTRRGANAAQHRLFAV